MMLVSFGTIEGGLPWRQRRSMSPGSTRSWDKMVNEMGAAMNGALVLLGDQLGLYKAMADGGAMTAGGGGGPGPGAGRALRREWLRTNAAGGYVTYDAGADSTR